MLSMLKNTRYSIAAAALSLALTTASPVLAAANEQEAQEIKSSIEQYITQQRQLYKMQGANLITKGDVQVTPKGKYYAVILPHISSEDKQYNVTEVGVISMNVAPIKGTPRWKASVALPTPINVYENGNELQSQIIIGKQRATFVWDTQLDSPVTADATYENVQIRSLDPQIDFSIPKITYKVNMKENKDGTWTGPASVDLFNLVGSGENNFGLDIEHTTITATVDSLSSNAVEKHLDTANALAESFELNNDKDIASSPHFKAYGNMILDYYTNAANGMGFKIDATNIRIKGQTVESPDSNLLLGSFIFDTQFKDLKSDRTTFDADIQARGIKAQPTPSTLPVLFPEDTTFNFTVHNFPFQSVFKKTKEQLRINQGEHGGGYVKETLLADQLPQMAMDAGTYITLQDTQISNDNFKFLFDGRLQPDTTAPQPMTGNIKMTIYNHDKLMNTFMMNAAQIPFLSMPLMFQSLAVQSTDKDGIPVHIYDFQITKQGNLTINGQSLGGGGLLGGFGR